MIQPQPAATQRAPEGDLFQVLVGRVRSGDPIYVLGTLGELQGKLHLAQIARLKRETGRPVHVIYS